MRRKNKSKPRGSVIAALDVGSSKIACFIARVLDDEGNLEVLGVGHQKSHGVKAGKVVDINQAETAIRQAVHAAENMAAQELKGYPLQEVVVNVSGNQSRSDLLSVDVQVSGQEVTAHDVTRAMDKAQEKGISAGCELIHTIAASYALDGNDGIRAPIGMVGDTLRADIHLISGDISSLSNLATPIEKSHLDISALCSSPYAAGLASLVEDEMDLGCTLIDMGGGVTSIAAFQGGSLIYTDAVPLGGFHVTNDIAKGLTTSLEDAERIKTLYGSAMASGTDDGEVIDVPRLGEEGLNRINHIPRAQLIGVIQPRLEEIFEHIRAKLEDSGVAPLVGRRVVLTGGASQLPSMRELAQLVLNKQVRLGRPIRINGLADAVSSPAFSTTAGLLTYYTDHAHEMPAEIHADVAKEGVWPQVKRWLKENW